MNRKNANICKDGGVFCKIEYPHSHAGPTVDDLVEPAKWPDRVYWKPPQRFNGRNPYRLFQFGWFASHSGFQLPWKLCLDSLGYGENSGWEDLAELVAWKFAFSSVYGIPKGGSKFAEALQKHAEPESGYPVLIVDDVLTTGKSFIKARADIGNPTPCIGIVVVARGQCPDWVFPILNVNEFFQSRATGLG
jgi:hypothetical protein